MFMVGPNALKKLSMPAVQRGRSLAQCRRTPKVYQAKNGLEDSKCTTFEGENGSS